MLATKIESNGALIAQVIRGKADRAAPSWEAAGQRLAELWLNWVKLLSSVQYASTKQLAQMGHPYARRQFRGKGRSEGRMQARYALPAEAYNINRQSGKLFAGWASSVQITGGQTIISITNSQDYFRWLSKGTRKMISRPIIEVALARASKSFPEVYEQTALRIHGRAQ